MDLAFANRNADYLLTTREEDGNVVPVLLSKGEDPGEANVDVPYQMVTILMGFYPWLNEGRIALVCRRCEEKALAELAKRGLVDVDRLVCIGLACSEKQIQECRCNDPVPSNVDLGEPGIGVKDDPLLSRLSERPQEKRLMFWVDQFKKCNKCFGCTSNCPVCFCDECLLEERVFTPESGIPPGLAFHLIRSFHLADKCVECGECERSCPVDIPLLTLRKMINNDMRNMFGFTSGDLDRSSPLLTTLDDQPLEDDTHVC